MSKYGAKPVWVAGNGETFSQVADSKTFLKIEGNQWFPSKLEYRVYIAIIKFAHNHNLLLDLERQITIELVPATGDSKAITWCVDFEATFTSVRCETFNLLIEAKGIQTSDYKLKKRLLQALHPAQFSRLIVIYDADDVGVQLYSKIKDNHD